MLFSGRRFLQLEAADFVDGHSSPYKKALWPYLSGRHIPPSSRRNIRAKHTPLSLTNVYVAHFPPTLGLCCFCSEASLAGRQLASGCLQWRLLSVCALSPREAPQLFRDAALHC